MNSKNKTIILCVDDEPRNLELLEAVLVPWGYEVIKVENGKGALEAAFSRRIDLILLDVMMPDIDGFEVCRRLRQDKETRLIPIVMVTALGETGDKIRGIDAGCDDFITKPFNRAELQARITMLLKINYYRAQLDEKEKYETVIHTAMDGFWLINTQGRILEVNDSYCRLTGYSRQELLTMSVFDLRVQEKPEDTKRHIQRIVESGSDRFESKHRCKDGRIVDLEVSVNYLDADGGRLFAFLRDITTRKRMEEELVKANKELWELDRMKDEFINMASHELRTPIAIIREGIAQIVEGLHGELGEQQKYFLDKSFKNVSRLIRVVDNIFEISEFYSGKVNVKKEHFDIVESARAVISGFEKEIKKTGLEIREAFPDKTEIFADKKRITRILTELVKNSLNFTAKGFVEIKIEDNGDSVECFVRDSGKGIAKENLPKVFDKFQQFDRDAGPGDRGTGLGLAIAKEIIKLHKGKIWVESVLDEGSKFTFSLPKENR